jgi:hypothetical protein
MRKIVTNLMFIMAVFTLTACASNSKKTSLDSTATTVSVEKMSLSKRAYDALIGTWECVDPDWSGEKVYISRNDKGLGIKYDDRENTKTKFVSKSDESEDVYYRFENKKEKLGYNIVLLKNGNIILNFGTTNPELTGLSKPMEYKRVTR